MDRNFNTDNLEDFFKKELQNDLMIDIDSNGWDMPSDGVWDNIEKGITVRQMPVSRWRNTKPWLSVAAALLFITVSYQALMYRQTINDLQEQINIHADKIEQLKDKKNTKNTEETTNTADYQNGLATTGSLPSTGENTITAEEKNQEALASNNDGKSNNEVSSLVAAAQAEKAGSIKKEDQENVPPQQQTSFGASQNRLAATETADRSIQDKNSQGQINSPELALLNQNLLALNIDSKNTESLDGATSLFTTKGSYKMIEPLQTKTRQRGLYAGAFYGPGKISKNFKGEGAADLRTLVNHEKVSESSFQTGIKIGYQLSENWSVESGLAYTKSRQKSLHELNFAFDPDKVSMNSQGEYEGTYASDLSTSYGDIPVDIQLSHGPAPNLPEGTPLPFKLMSKQDIEMVQLPVSLRYSIGNGPLKLSLSAGATANVLVHKEMKILPPPHNHPIPEMEELKHQGSRLKDGKKLDDMNNLSFSLTAGIDLDYALTDHLHLYVAPAFAKGITSVYEKDDVETELSQATVLLGVNYYF